MLIIGIYFNGEKIYNFKVGNKNVKGNVYDFSVNYDAIDISDILNIHKY